METLIVILGPTASGKTALSIRLAKKYKGEIISADSRQAYRGLDIGSGKASKREMQEIPHHLLDVASPRRTFTAAQFQKLAFKKIKQIQKRGNIPFLVGGTGLYIQSVVENLQFPNVPPNAALRKQIARKPADELFLLLKNLDPERAEHIDKKNPRRLIRAIEIVTSGGQAPQRSPAIFDVLQIGIAKPKEELKKAIAERLRKRLRQGMITEVKNLNANGTSWKRLESFGLEYRYIAQFLQGKLSKQEMTEKLQKEIEHFAKRQMTWFKRDERIHWVNNQPEAEALIEKFLRNKKSYSCGEAKGPIISL